MLIKVKVSPNSKQEKFIKIAEDNFEVEVKQKPLSGRANKAVMKLLASRLKTPEQKIKLVKGFKLRNKIFKLVKYEMTFKNSPLKHMGRTFLKSWL